MKITLTILCTIFLYLTASSQDAKTAHFDITTTDKNIVVAAEFPWTIHNALIEFNPSMKNDTSKQSYINTMKQYIEAHFHIITPFGFEAKLTDIKRVQKNEHSHQANFIFLFKKDSIHSIRNSLLFDQSPKHVNHHTITHGNTTKTFQTSISNNIYEPINNKNDINWWIISSLIMTLGIILTIAIVKQKRLTN